MSTEIRQLFAVDNDNTPLAVLDEDQIHRQSLLHRAIYLLMRVERERLVLRKRSEADSLFPGRWDIVGNEHIPIGLSAQETAEHCIPELLQSAELPLVELSSLKPESATGNEFVTVFQIRLPPRLARCVDNNLLFMSVDRDELQSLILNYTEMLTPAVHVVWKSGLAFGLS